MFIGHYAVALAAKRAAPKVSLGTLFLAAQLLDLLWPIFLLTGVEHVRVEPGNTPMTPFNFYDYPISHSLLTAILWGLLVGLIYFLVRKNYRGAWIVCAVVISHWVLDFFTHRPDLPLMPGASQYVGLGLWYSVPLTLIVEGGMFVAANILYQRSFPAKDRIGGWMYWFLMGLLLGFWLSAAFEEPPADWHFIAWSAMLLWLFVPWGYWIDRHRAQASVNS